MVWKGHRELVEALAKVKQAVPEVRLFVVGVEDTLAAQSAESYAGQVRARVSELGLEENVIWAGWLEDVPAVMADLDVLAIPSWEEPFGLVVAEAMAMERPVVGFCSGALPEIITNGEEGLLVPARDVEALADALIRLLTDPCRRAEMGRKGRARVLQQFTPARQVAEVEQFYRTLITEGRSEKERI
jgi:glycosyltransferase involved in cell wall biosynthesis